MIGRFLTLLLLLPLMGYGQGSDRARRESFQPSRNEDFFIRQLSVRQLYQSRAQSSESEIFIGQNGFNNRLGYANSGQDNTVRFNQNGGNNEIELNLSSNNSTVDLTQNGNNNELRLTDIADDGTTQIYSQTGDNNSLVQEGGLGLGAKGVSMRVEQSGGMRLTITHGN